MLEITLAESSSIPSASKARYRLYAVLARLSGDVPTPLAILTGFTSHSLIFE